MLVIEEILDRIARRLGIAPDVVRERNFYREGDVTHYGQPVKDAGRIDASGISSKKPVPSIGGAGRSRVSTPPALT